MELYSGENAINTQLACTNNKRQQIMIRLMKNPQESDQMDQKDAPQPRLCPGDNSGIWDLWDLGSLGSVISGMSGLSCKLGVI